MAIDPATPAAPPRGISGSKLAGALVAILAIIAGAYGGVLRNGFVYDDRALVEGNPAIRSFSNAGDWLTRSFWASAYNPADADRVPFYRPVMTAVLATGHAIGGEDPAVFHALALAFHLAATALLFALARRFLPPAGALAAAALFGLTPVHTETVAWVSGMVDAVAATFALAAALACLAAGDAAGTPGRRGRAAILSGATALLALLSFLSKESALGIPAAILVADLLLSRRPLRPRLLPYAGYALALVAYLALRMRVYGLDAGFGIRQTWFGLPAWRSTTLPFELFAGHLGKLFEPFGLNAFRTLRVDLEPLGAEILLAFGLCGLWAAALAALALGSLRRSGLRAPLAFAAFVTLTILPMVVRPSSLGYFPFAERFLYVPSLGWALLAGWIAAALARRAPWAAAAIVVVVATAFAWRTAERVPVWRTEETLFGRSAVDSPDCAAVHRALGRIAMERYERTGDPAELDVAFEAYARTIDRSLRDRVFVSSEDVIQAHLGLAWIHLIRGRAEEALSIGQQVSEEYPTNEHAAVLAGVAAAALGDVDRAERELRRAVDLRPNFGRARFNLGRLLYGRGAHDAAVLELRTAVDLEPTNADARYFLGCALFATGQPDAALPELQRAADLAPGAAATHAALGRLQLARGSPDAGVTSLRRALDLAPGDVDVRFELGSALLGIGRRLEGHTELERALAEAPDHPLAEQVRSMLERP